MQSEKGRPPRRKVKQNYFIGEREKELIIMLEGEAAGAWEDLLYRKKKACSVVYIYKEAGSSVYSHTHILHTTTLTDTLSTHIFI